MYRLLTGLYAYARRKEEFSVLILGLDNAGKTTFLERVKSTFNQTPVVDPASIAPTIGQNIGRILLSSAVLQFWDLGGQSDIRVLWPKYYSECHAVCFVIDSTATERLEECWKVFETMVEDYRVEGVPILVLANKSDAKDSMPVDDIKLIVNRLINTVEKLNVSESAVMAISALNGEGIREAVNWLFLRVHHARQAPEIL